MVYLAHTFNNAPDAEPACCSDNYGTNVQIPSHHILSVQRYDSLKDMLRNENCMFKHKCCSTINHDMKNIHMRLITLLDLYGMTCPCVNQHEDGFGEKDLNEDCKGLDQLFPLYSVTVENKLMKKVRFNEKLGKMEAPPICTYILHHSEHEHIGKVSRRD